jgi:hypothetical protein
MWSKKYSKYRKFYEKGWQIPDFYHRAVDMCHSAGLGDKVESFKSAATVTVQYKISLAFTYLLNYKWLITPH